MPALTEARPASTTLLAVRSANPEAGSPERAWSVPGAAVSTIERLSDWSGEAPLDVAVLLGGASGDEAEARVIVVQTRGAQLPLLARGGLSLLHTSPTHLLALPAAFQSASPLVEQVALLEGSPALFVLSPERLFEAWQRALSPVAASSPDSSPSLQR